MSLIMDALEKIQREKQDRGAEAPAPVRAAAAVSEPQESAQEGFVQAPAGAFVLDPLLPQSSFEVFRNSFFFSVEILAARCANALQWRWLPMGLGACLVLATTVYLFQRSALQFMQPAAHPVSLPGVILEKIRAQQGILRGIVQDQSGGFCLIGDRVLKKGDTWRDYQVVAIGLREVTLKNAENRFLTLSLRE